MSQQTTGIGFVGGGRIVRIFLEGWSRARALPESVVVSDCNEEVLKNLQERFPNVQTVVDNAQAAAQNMVFLAVHPPVVVEVLGQIQTALSADSLLVSLVPKWTIAELSKRLGGFDRIARVIPNAASIVGQGYNPLAFSPSLSEKDRSLILTVLQPLGESPEVKEQTLEGYAVVSAMSPTWLWPQWLELVRLGKQFGIEESEARQAVLRSVQGAVATLLDSGLTGEQVQDLVPVKPLAEEVDQWLQAYRTRLTSLWEKIRPAE